MFIIIANKKRILKHSVFLFFCVVSLLLIYNFSSVAQVSNFNGKKYIAVIIDDFGYNGAGTKEMAELGIPITAAVMPGLETSEEDAAYFSDNDFDVIVHMPMEPINGKASWLGPMSVKSSMSSEATRETIQKAIDNISYAVGMNNHMGSKIMEDSDKVNVIMDVAKEIGLIFIDSKTTNNSKAKSIALEKGVKYFERDIFLDNEKNADAVYKQMEAAKKIADKRGYAIVIGHVGTAGGMETVIGLRNSIPTLTKEGYTFVTISQLSSIINGS